MGNSDSLFMTGRMYFGRCVSTLAILLFHETAGFNIRNEQLGECLQVVLQDANPGVGLGQCSPGSMLQEWQWIPESRALSSLHTRECLSGHEHELSVQMQPCGPGNEAGVITEADKRDRTDQAWVCSKKGHLTLLGKVLHLSAHHVSSKVFLSQERGPASKWRTLGNNTVCGKRDGPHHRHRSTQPAARLPSTIDGVVTPIITEMDPVTEHSHLPETTSAPQGPAMTFFNKEYGFGWKVTMLVLSSLALLLGAVMLMLNIHQNRKKKKVLCVLNSYSPMGMASQPGSPMPSERARLTQHPMPPARSPSLQHGEILIEWKDGTFTPLFNSYLAD
ncbi:hypothetical protein UPYG_G00189500 [Umbra pygmaea]|uniref:Ricin B lectin domain-containing protein n=1 Tax=Umbra pygmaea TaxID=75934 RepID=A0ABD0WU05_UMBPY